MKALILISLLVSGCALYYEREYDEGSEYLRSSADEPSAVAAPRPQRRAAVNTENGQYVIPASECIGAVVNGVCHGTPTPGESIRMQTGQTPKCYGTMIGGSCTGPMF